MASHYGFVCIIAVLYPWYYTVVLYSSLKPNEYYTVRMSPLVTDRYEVQMSPTWSPWSSDFRESEGCWLATKCEISDLSLSIRNGEAKRCYLGEVRSLLQAG
jgi:hypothetical protein